MSRRMSRDEAVSADPKQPRLLSEFVENDLGQSHFVIRTVPLPPDVRQRVIRDNKRLELQETVDIRCGCPHCHRDVEFRFEIRNATRSLIDRMSEAPAQLRSPELLIAAGLMNDQESLKRYNNLVRIIEDLTNATRY